MPDVSRSSSSRSRKMLRVVSAAAGIAALAGAAVVGAMQSRHTGQPGQPAVTLDTDQSSQVAIASGAAQSSRPEAAAKSASAGVAYVPPQSDTSAAAGFPKRPITFVVTFPPGGGTDTLARRLGQRLETVLGQPVIVENRAGASGNIGAHWVARSAPDGYTLLVVNSTYAINPGVYRDLGFDPAHDLRGVINVAYVPSVLVTKADTRWKNLRQVLSDYGNAAHKAPSFASCGNGTPQHLAGEMLAERAGAAWLHVPYKGCGPALAAAMANTVDVAIVTASSAAPLIEAGTLRALAVTSPSRSKLLPDIPTVAEAGFPGYELDQWHGFLAPAATPDAVVARLNRAIASVMKEPDMIAALRTLGYNTTATSAAAFQEIIETDMGRFAALTKKMGLQVD